MKQLRAVGVLVAVLALAAAGCGGSGGSDAKASKTALAKGPVNLSFWSWSPSTAATVKAFEKAHPNIHVKVVNAGAGSAEYSKFRAALAARNGAPDIVMLGFPYVSAFATAKGIVDLSEYGAGDVAGNFAPWYLDLVKQSGKGLYALPTDAGVMGMMYREDLFKKAGIDPPKTWDEFARAATRLHAAAPGSYLTSFPPDFEYFMSFAWQAGARPFSLDGTNLTIHIDSPEALKAASYWDGLIEQGVVQVAPFFTNSWYAAVDRGTYASWLTASWGPVLVSGTSKTMGKWRVAPLPQWSAGEDTQPLYSGSAYAVTTQSKHPAEAAALVKYVTSTTPLLKAQAAVGKYGFIPYKPIYEDPEWLDETTPFYGPQKPNRVFAEAAEHVDGTFQWGPIADYVVVQGGKYMASELSHGGTIANALRKLQADAVAYAKRQGYTVQ